MVREFGKFAAKATYVFFLFLFTLAIGGLIIYQTVIEPAQEEDSIYEDTFQVKGEAERKVTPDQASITVGTLLEGTNILELQDKAHGIVNKAVADFKALGIKEENISTNQYSVSVKRDSTGEKITGYQINVNIRVLVENTNPKDNAVSNVITKATAAGLNEVSSLSYVVSNEEDILEELKLEAIDDAKAKAETEADKAGLKIGDVINISTNGYYPYYYSRNGSASVAEDATKPSEVVEPEVIEIQPGQHELTYTVTLYYEIK